MKTESWYANTTFAWGLWCFNGTTLCLRAKHGEQYVFYWYLSTYCGGAHSLKWKPNVGWGKFIYAGFSPLKDQTTPNKIFCCHFKKPMWWWEWGMSPIDSGIGTQDSPLEGDLGVLRDTALLKEIRHWGRLWEYITSLSFEFSLCTSCLPLTVWSLSSMLWLPADTLSCYHTLWTSGTISQSKIFLV